MWNLFRFTLVRRGVELIAAMLISFVVEAILTGMGFELDYKSNSSITKTILYLLWSALFAPILFFSLTLYAPVAAILEALVWVFHKRFTPIILLIPSAYSLLWLIGFISIALENSQHDSSNNGFLYGIVAGTVLFTLAQYWIGREVYEQVVKGFKPSKPRLVLTEDKI